MRPSLWFLRHNHNHTTKHSEFQKQRTTQRQTQTPHCDYRYVCIGWASDSRVRFTPISHRIKRGNTQPQSIQPTPARIAVPKKPRKKREITRENNSRGAPGAGGWCVWTGAGLPSRLMTNIVFAGFGAQTRGQTPSLQK
jgi:hypothetical protein